MVKKEEVKMLCFVCRQEIEPGDIVYDYETMKGTVLHMHEDCLSEGYEQCLERDFVKVEPAPGVQHAGMCHCCNEPIDGSEGHVILDGKTFHEDCVRDNASMYVTEYIKKGIAE
jgi:hypothetical protein